MSEEQTNVAPEVQATETPKEEVSPSSSDNDEDIPF